ncbi:MAG: hypothetical protein HOB98_15175 [Gammaproteobacteria bacterium]|jgi:hypothetical protein|nr:hypothetical protein [Gammaproteobacteria bacterium]MBT4378390.1 hypothetical protein [Gammaproteobacteria bacterium]MBT4617785.1 hypothetical protein [Gammaproteobacteria bacterium]MBT5197747.1 hypothetical protein [Gammaproteobacteria bacterium]MBT5442795.1 hypothetical protein [Gammaproteobacteria bacterium]
MKYLLPVILILSSLLLAACEPKNRRPGTWLSGELVEDRIEDWSFSNEFQEVFIQTHPWYGIPHSVTTVLATADGKLYVPSVYVKEPKRFPDGKYWNRIVAEYPNVEVKIGDQLYPRTVNLISDEAEFGRGLNALAAKYPFWQKVKGSPEEAPSFVILRLNKRNP